jgi:hypothetical protein|tara:strand:- start:1703 stop:1867 length:165 start_codon:yes stop_codon:yes gene_type:complete
MVYKFKDKEPPQYIFILASKGEGLPFERVKYEKGGEAIPYNYPEYCCGYVYWSL